LFIDYLLKALIGIVVHGAAVKDGYAGSAAATSKLASADSAAGRMATGGPTFVQVLCRSYFLL
jgi:hypothetical protein